MHFSVMKWFMNAVSIDEFKDKDILDIGSYDVNGSLRSIIQPTLAVKSYLGTDILAGSGVDQIVSADCLLDKFGEKSFDIIICTEMLEHAYDWQTCIMNIKYLLRSNGMLILTTRSEGFPLHDFPDDYWRFSLDDMKYIFEDMIIENLCLDPQYLGVFIRVKKPDPWLHIQNLVGYDVYSMQGRTIV